MNMISEQAAAEVAVPSGGQRGRRGRRRKVVGGVSVAVVIAAGAAAVVLINPFRGSGPSASASSAPTATATVTERSLSSQTQVDATLGYAHDYSVVVPSAGGGSSSPSEGSTGASSQGASGTSPSGGSSGGQGGGTFTWLPAVGKVIHQGHALYDVDGSPVVLLDGSAPAYRTLSEGTSGSDVRALNADLVTMGYATKSELDPKSSYFGAATVTALEKLQGKLGVSKTGSLALGQAVFLPTAARVTSITATLGAPAQGGASVLQATSTKRQVTAQLDATQQSDVAKGDKVTITLPNNQTTPGVVTSVGTVASAPSNNGSGSSSGSSDSSSSSDSSGTTATIQVNIKPSDPKATGTLTQAPVQVMITTATVKHALVVPVDALLARASGGYAVEVVSANGGRHLVPVSLGIFDDADGLVQVTGSQLSAGQSVVVPKI